LEGSDGNVVGVEIGGEYTKEDVEELIEKYFNVADIDRAWEFVRS